MKIARIVLTATILLSLKSTLHCSSSEESRTKPSTNARNLPIYDAADPSCQIQSRLFTTQDPFKWTLENFGQSYNHWGMQACTVSPSEKIISAWEDYGKNIKDLNTAELYLRVMEQSGLLTKLSEDSIEPASNLIRLNSVATYVNIQKSGDSLIRSIYNHENQSSEADDSRKAQEEYCNTLKELAINATAHRIKHNTMYPDHKITEHPFMHTEKAKKINVNDLRTVATTYITRKDFQKRLAIENSKK